MRETRLRPVVGCACQDDFRLVLARQVHYRLGIVFGGEVLQRRSIHQEYFVRAAMNQFLRLAVEAAAKEDCADIGAQVRGQFTRLIEQLVGDR